MGWKYAIACILHVSEHLQSVNFNLEINETANFMNLGMMRFCSWHYRNMVPVPFIILYLKKFATFLAAKNKTASQFLDKLFEMAKAKAGPVEEFQWLGLMLFVAVPFPGTGAWTGAIIASILDMPFWSGVSANFVGVVLAGLLVNLLVNLGLKYAIITGVLLFIISTFMWSILRSLKKSLNSASS